MRYMCHWSDVLWAVIVFDAVDVMWFHAFRKLLLMCDFPNYNGARNIAVFCCPRMIRQVNKDIILSSAFTFTSIGGWPAWNIISNQSTAYICATYIE